MPPPPRDWVLTGRRVALPQGVRPAAVIVRGEAVSAVVEPSAIPAGLPCVDAGDDVVLPGLVDTHAHINEPGRADWEGFLCATQAAAAGGITAVVDMPLNCIPPTTTLEALDAKRLQAAGNCAVDVGFWGGVVPGNAAQLAPMAAAGAMGFKAFLIDSGVPEFPMVREPDLRAAMKTLAKLGRPLLAHAELCDHPAMSRPSRHYSDYLASRPPEWETLAIRLLLRLSDETGCHVHIVHLSAAEALTDISFAKRTGLPISAETCPHYLALEAEFVEDGETQFKCAPPIRKHENREKLWRGLRENVIDFIVSDHSPCPAEMKRLDIGDFSKAWGGISSIQFSLPVVWTELYGRGLGFEHLARWMSERPAAFAGISSKGAIAPGKDADFVIFDPDEEFEATADSVLHRHKVSPYVGAIMRGRVRSTFLRGTKIYEDGAFVTKPQGKLLAAPAPSLPHPV